MTHLKEGDPAPAFSGTDQNGNKVSLTDFTGNRLVLFFYPKANTPGCTAEACNLRDNYRELLAKGFKIVGVSADDLKKQKKFSDQYNLPFPLITDTSHEVTGAYGVWGRKKFLGREYDGIFRTTFVVSETGIIEKVFTDVKTSSHTAQILNTMNL
jgi:thioredoxin-dependent peroxiredoxin